MPVLNTLPTVLKYLPVEKAQDARASCSNSTGWAVPWTTCATSC